MARLAAIFEGLREDRLRAIRLSSTAKRDLRDKNDPFALTDAEFIANYRISKDIFQNLCYELAHLLPTGRRRTFIGNECKIQTALSFYASGSYQRSVGMSYLHGVSQPSVSKILHQVTAALNSPEILHKYIKFPQNRAERDSIIRGFSDKFGMPGVMACVDGTHVALVRPEEHEERFFNRKHYHSRNVQIICDSDLNILNVDATFGGATHDSFIWRNCDIAEHMQQLYRTGEAVWFLGDSGYALRPWMITPILNAAPGSPEEHFTTTHCRARNTVERCIGVLKARWRCLLAHRVLHYDPGTVAQIINACCVLHNIANGARLPVPDIPEVELH